VVHLFPPRLGRGDRGRAAPGADQLGAILFAACVGLDQAMNQETAERYERDDPTFIEDLIASEGAVWKAIRWLYGKLSCDVTIRGRKIRESISDISDWDDRGDLVIHRGQDPERIEVKRRSLHFTNLSNYPYPTVIVDVAHTFDRAEIKPTAYLIFNDHLTHVIVISTKKTRESWTRTERPDHGKNRVRTFYECPKELVYFYEL
jgi:hypothetical protein